VKRGFMTNLKEECKNDKQKSRCFGKYVEQRFVGQKSKCQKFSIYRIMKDFAINTG
jgi:hypothetical protein